MKLKRPKQLQEVLDIARFLLSEGQNSENKDVEIEEKRSKLDQLKSVLEMYGYFSGINRKVQLKYQPKGRPRASSSDDGNVLFHSQFFIHMSIKRTTIINFLDSLQIRLRTHPSS